MSEAVKRAHELIDTLARLVEQYRKEQNVEKRVELLTKIIDTRTELELLITQISRV